MPLKSYCFGIALLGLVFGIAMVLTTGKAEAQTTNCTNMGSSMTHCTTMGPSGGMSSTDCMAMGLTMATCNTIGGGGGFTGGGPAASPVDIYRMIFGDKTRKNIGKLLANGDCEGAARYAYEHGRLEFGLKIEQSCRPSNAPSYAASNRAPIYGHPASAAQSVTTLYQTVDYLARNVPVPFAADTAAGTVAVTKIEASNTQLRMNVQVNDSRATLANVASPANLQVICADPNFSKVLRLGNSATGQGSVAYYSQQESIGDRFREHYSQPATSRGVQADTAADTAGSSTARTPNIVASPGGYSTTASPDRSGEA